jgi:glycosyltransferase involved in cell wall biosynthesis
VDDEYVRSIRARIRDAGDADSVIFTGRVPNPQDYLRAADVFALMSRGEGFPAAVLEAMACGLPFILWNLPDYAGYDLQDGAQGFLLPAFDTRLLAARLGEFARSPEMQQAMGRRALELASKYPFDRSVTGHILFYRELAPVPVAGEGMRPASSAG